MEQVHSLHRGAAPRQEGGHEKTGSEGAQFGSDLLAFQGEMAPQGRIATAHHQPAVDRAGGDRLGQQGLERAAEAPQPGAGLLGRQVPGVDQQKEQGRRIGQALAKGGNIPAQQQGAAVHRLGAGGVVVKDDDLEEPSLGCHGWKDLGLKGPSIGPLRVADLRVWDLSHGTIVP